jgi:hypothetical protein
LVTADEEFIYGYHARKLICKLREVMAFDPGFVFYKEFPEK